MNSTQSAPLRWRGRDALLVATLTALSATISAVAIRLHPAEMYDAQRFLFADEGLSLESVERVLQGARSYRDIYFLYGPLTLGWHAFVARIFGNTPQTLIWLLAAETAVGVAIATIAIRKSASRLSTAVVVAACLMPCFVIPGASFASYTGAPTLGLERIVLLGLAATWSPPRTRTVARGVALGVLLGAWQWVKFGGGIFAAVAVVALDVFALLVDRQGWPSRTWLRAMGATIVAAALVEAGLVEWAFSSLPPDVARDLVWPAYILKQYASFPSVAQWPGLKLFVGTQLGPVVGLVLSLAGAGWLVRGALRGGPKGASSAPDDETIAKLGVYVPLAFFLLAGSGYLHHIHHLFSVAWTVCPAAAFALDRLPLRARFVPALAWLPGLFLTLRGTAPRAPQAHEIVASRTHGWLAFTADELAETKALLARLARDGHSPDAPAVIMPMGSGFHYFFDVPHEGRQFLYVPAVVRPRDEDELLASMDRLSALVFVPNNWTSPDSPPPDPCAVYNHSYLTPIFSAEVCTALAARFTPPEPVGKWFWVSRPRPPVEAQQK